MTITRIRDVSFEDDVIDRLARIETDLHCIKDHEKRIRSLEKSQWLFTGAAIVTSQIIGFIATHVGKWTP